MLIRAIKPTFRKLWKIFFLCHWWQSQHVLIPRRSNWEWCEICRANASVADLVSSQWLHKLRHRGAQSCSYYSTYRVWTVEENQRHSDLKWWRRGGKGDCVLQVINCVGGCDVTSAPTSPSHHPVIILLMSARIVDELRPVWLLWSVRTEIPTNLSWLTDAATH